MKKFHKMRIKLSKKENKYFILILWKKIHCKKTVNLELFISNNKSKLSHQLTQNW